VVLVLKLDFAALKNLRGGTKPPQGGFLVALRSSRISVEAHKTALWAVFIFSLHLDVAIAPESSVSTD